MFFSFSRNKFYFDNGITSDGYSYENTPEDALEIYDSEIYWSRDTNFWEFNKEFLGRIISEGLVNFSLTVNPKNGDGTVGEFTIIHIK